jgi:hypothetical protein
MASPIAYTHEPGDTVWVIITVGDCAAAVKSGTVIQVIATALITTTTVAYHVRLGTDNGTTEILEDNIFATLADAVAEYEIRLT